MGHYRDVGHGHVWERPDGLKAPCGGPGLCSECAADAMRVREVKGLYDNDVDVAILLRAKDACGKNLASRDKFLGERGLFNDYMKWLEAEKAIVT